MYPDPTTVTRVTSIGAGPIGGGWAAHFLARGHDVTACIQSDAERPALMAVIKTAWHQPEDRGQVAQAVLGGRSANGAEGCEVDSAEGRGGGHHRRLSYGQKLVTV